MTNLLALFNGTIVAAIGLLHAYWMLGGRWGWSKALPSSESGALIMNSGPVACLVVAVGLLGFALYYFSLGLHFPLGLPFKAGKWGIWVLAGIFLLRAAGDFRYVGFFKKVKNTAFGRMDTRWYAPLCAVLGFTSILIGVGR